MMLKTITSTLLGFLLLAAPTFAQQDGYRYDHGHMFGGDGWGYMFMGPLMMIAFIAATVVLLVLAFRWLSADHGKRSSENDDAMGVLRKRFASGEIDEEEFEALREKAENDLSKENVPTFGPPIKKRRI